MRIFVTGASGFVGRNLVQQLVAKGHVATALLLPGEPDIEGPGVRCVRGDITAASTLDGLFQGHDAVVHLAGAVADGLTQREAHRLNVAGTDNVARTALREGVTRFIHMSTVAVYGREPGVRLHEERPLCPTGDPYGDTKLLAERLLRELALEGALELTVLRPTVIYGPGDGRFLPRLVANLFSGQARLIGTGLQTVDAVHVDDVVGFILQTLDNYWCIGSTYNLNHPSNPSWKDFVGAVAETLGVPTPTQRLPYGLAWMVAGCMELWARISNRPPRLTRYAVKVIGRQYHYDTSRAEALGFEPRVELVGGVRELLAPGTGAPEPVAKCG